MAKTNTKGMSKMDAVRGGLKDLGNAAMPKQLQPHIKEKYGIDMSVDHVSTYKSVILRKGKKKKGKAAATKQIASANGVATAVTAPKAAPTTPAARKPTAGSISEQVAMLKAVAGAIGKEEAKKILDLL